MRWRIVGGEGAGPFSSRRVTRSFQNFDVKFFVDRLASWSIFVLKKKNNRKRGSDTFETDLVYIYIPGTLYRIRRAFDFRTTRWIRRNRDATNTRGNRIQRYRGVLSCNVRVYYTEGVTRKKKITIFRRRGTDVRPI